jgi:hypothetical protein
MRTDMQPHRAPEASQALRQKRSGAAVIAQYIQDLARPVAGIQDLTSPGARTAPCS